MASTPETTKYPPALFEAAELRWKSLGYRNKAEYRRGLERYDLMVQGPHHVTVAISHMSDSDQDLIDAGLLELTKKGIGTRGNLLANVVAEVVKLGEEPTGEAIAEVIRRSSAKSRTKQIVTKKVSQS